jgi:hydrogenase/urease accessory protein HupE
VLRAHPAPFSYLTVRLDDSRVDAVLVMHTLDVAHDLGVSPADTLLDAAVLSANADAIRRLVRERLAVSIDGVRAALPADAAVEAMPDRAGIGVRWSLAASRLAGTVRIETLLFPYDPNHQTFLNVYQRVDLIRQDVLDRNRTAVDVFTGTTQGRLAVWRAFTMSGIHHIAIGPDHILFIVGLLLLGGTLRRLLLIVSAFTLGHTITLSLATLGLLQPPAHIVEPAIALSIVYVGADNLLVGQQGRDMRPWVALFFGLVHGFGFASVLRQTGLPERSIGLSLFSFNLGVEIGQAVIVVCVSGALAAIRRRKPPLAQRIAVVGSVIVIAAGGYWFVQRVFF